MRCATTQRAQCSDVQSVRNTINISRARASLARLFVFTDRDDEEVDNDDDDDDGEDDGMRATVVGRERWRRLEGARERGGVQHFILSEPRSLCRQMQQQQQ